MSYSYDTKIYLRDSRMDKMQNIQIKKQGKTPFSSSPLQKSASIIHFFPLPAVNPSNSKEIQLRNKDSLHLNPNLPNLNGFETQNRKQRGLVAEGILHFLRRRKIFSSNNTKRNFV
jgi:hypothetical protein